MAMLLPDVELPPALGMARGQLYLGATLLAASITSFAIRHGGLRGPCLLYTTQASFIFARNFDKLVDGAELHGQLKFASASTR